MLRRSVLFGVPAALPILADDKPAMRTHQYLNGRYWKVLNEAERIAFVLSVHDSILWFATGETMEDKIKKDHQAWFDRFFTSDFTSEDITKQMGRLYEEPANLNLPILLMHLVSCDIFRGTAPDKVTATLADFRRRYSNQ